MSAAVLAFLTAVISATPEIISDIEKLIADFKASPAGQNFAQTSAAALKQLELL